MGDAGRGIGGGGAWSAHQRQVDQGATDVAAGAGPGRIRSLPLAKAAHQRYQVNRAQARHP